MKNTDWKKAIQPLLKKYRKKKHPLDYKNPYQLLVMVLLSAQVTDEAVNRLAKSLFDRFPSFQELARAGPEELYPYIKSARFFRQKAERLVSIAKILTKKSMPETMDGLLELPGISRKSANVILRELGSEAEGIIVDLHVLRVAPRLGMTKEEKAEKVEQDLMAAVPQEYWSDTGMAISWLGREICRPTDPKCKECVMNKWCAYYKGLKK